MSTNSVQEFSFVDHQGEPITLDRWGELYDLPFETRVLRNEIASRLRLSIVWTGEIHTCCDRLPFGLVVYPARQPGTAASILREYMTPAEANAAFDTVIAWMRTHEDLMPTPELLDEDQ